MNRIGGGMIGNSNCIGTILNGLILDQPPKIVKPFSVSSIFFYINKNYRSAHFFGHSKLKELDIDDFYKRKQMNEETESETTEMDSIPDHLEVSEYEGADEAVPIRIRKERTTKAYKETMIQDIENIDTYETRATVNITQWRPIYEVIDEAYIKECNIFPDDFIREYITIQTNHNLYQVT